MSGVRGAVDVVYHFLRGYFPVPLDIPETEGAFQPCKRLWSMLSREVLT